MQLYEIQGKDGKMYEIEGDSPEDAFAALDALIDGGQSNSPVTPPEGDARYPSLSMDNIEAQVNAQNEKIDEGFGKTRAMLKGASGAASFGLSDAAQRYVGAAVDKAMFNEDNLSYSDLLDRVTKENNQDMADHPGYGLMGTVAGSVLGGKAALDTAGKAVPWLAKGIAGRMTGAAALGGIEAPAVAAGRGELEKENVLGLAAMGAGFGMLGQGIGEVVAPAGRFIKSRATEAGAEEAAKRKLAHSLMDDATGAESVAAAVNNGKGLSQDDLLALANDLGDGRHLGEANPKMLELYTSVAKTPEATGRLSSTTARAEQHLAELPARANEAIENVLVNPNRQLVGQEARQASALRQDEARAAYREIFDSDEGRYVAVTTGKELRARAKNLKDSQGYPVFDEATMTAPARAVLKRFNSMVKSTGDGKEIPLKGLQNLRTDLNDMISNSWSESAASGAKMRTSDMIALRTMIDDTMKGSSDKYAQASAKFAAVEDEKRAYEAGRKLIRGTNTTAPVDEVKAYIDSLSGPELNHAQDGALEWLKGQLDQSDTALRKLAQSNPDMMGRIQAIFGEDIQIEELAEALDSMAQQKAAYTKLSKAETSTIKNALPSRSGNEATSMLDKLVTLIGLGPQRGVPVSPLRRVLMGDHQALNKQLLNLLQQDNPEAAKTLMDELIQMRAKPRAGTTGGAIGAGGFSGLLSEF